MTPQQTALVQQILTIVGTIVTAMGWGTASDVSTWITTIMQAIGPVAALGGLVWALITTRKTALVTAVASLPEVRAVVTEPTVEGRSLAGTDSTPLNVVVAQPAGSPIPPTPPHP